jgi:hypothetical protein
MNYKALDFVQLTDEFLKLAPSQSPEIDKVREIWLKKFRELNRFDFHESSNPAIEEKIKAILEIIKVNPFVWEHNGEVEDVFELRQEWETIENEEMCSGDWYYHFQKYFDLIPPFVKRGTKIPPEIKTLYYESRCCFIYGQFNACIALSRALIESIAKDRLKLKRQPGEERLSIRKYLKFLEKYKYISEDCREGLNVEVIERANDILHEGKLGKEKESLDVINWTRKFIEQIYSKRSFFSN